MLPNVLNYKVSERESSDRMMMHEGRKRGKEWRQLTVRTFERIFSYVRENSILRLLFAGDGVLQVAPKLQRVFLHLNHVRAVERIFVDFINRVVVALWRWLRCEAVRVEVIVAIAGAVDDAVAETQVAALWLIVHGKIRTRRGRELRELLEWIVAGTEECFYCAHFVFELSEAIVGRLTFQFEVVEVNLRWRWWGKLKISGNSEDLRQNFHSL